MPDRKDNLIEQVNNASCEIDTLVKYLNRCINTHEQPDVWACLRNAVDAQMFINRAKYIHGEIDASGVPV